MDTVGTGRAFRCATEQSWASESQSSTWETRCGTCARERESRPSGTGRRGKQILPVDGLDLLPPVALHSHVGELLAKLRRYRLQGAVGGQFSAGLP